jgi:putative phosphoribosyl transferase
MEDSMRFRNRSEAGRLLASRLGSYADRSDLLTLALPRGGVPVANEIARALGAPLDVFVVCKLVSPEHAGVAIGAAASGGVRFVNQPMVEKLRVSELSIQRLADEAERELARLETVYRGDRRPLDVRGRTAIVVDDGIATGATMRAAVLALQQLQPERIVVAVPVAPASTAEDLRQRVEEVVCLNVPDEEFTGLGIWYDDFTQPSEDDVRRMLGQRVMQAKRTGA